MKQEFNYDVEMTCIVHDNNNIFISKAQHAFHGPSILISILIITNNRLSSDLDAEQAKNCSI